MSAVAESVVPAIGIHEDVPIDTDWRAIPNSPYEVSSAGAVRRTKDSAVTHGGVRSRAGRVLSGRWTGAGYLHVYIAGRGMVYVHRLVAEAFIPNPDNLPVVNHLNGVRSDNRRENLEWTTQRGNIHHAMRAGAYDHRRPIRGEQHGMARITAAQVREIRDMYATGNYSLAQVASQFGLTKSGVHRIVRRIAWKHVV